MTYTKDEMTRMQIGMHVCIFICVYHIIRLKLLCCVWLAFFLSLSLSFLDCWLRPLLLCSCFFIVLGRNSIDSVVAAVAVVFVLHFILLFTS